MIVAGRYVRAIQYTMHLDPDVRRTRAPKEQISSVAREAMNLNQSWQKLKALLASNFLETDLVVSLTYYDASLPPTRKAAESRLKAFIRLLRESRRETQQEPLKYIYVTEQGHLSGRLHHHIVINSTGADYKLIRDLWARNGDNIDFSPIWTKGYDGWARYLSKESRETGRRYVGERMWRQSLGLAKPVVDASWVDASDQLIMPPGAIPIDSQQRENIYGRFSYVEYLLPTQKQHTAPH